ncbi:hypothetical protein HaLaN_07067, partial [Haematococcus lacustris]
MEPPAVPVALTIAGCKTSVVSATSTAQVLVMLHEYQARQHGPQAMLKGRWSWSWRSSD